MIDLDDVRRAAARLDGVAHRTPVVTSRTLDARTGATVRLKPENLQRVGAFKFRGAYNTVAQLDAPARASRPPRPATTPRRSRSRPRCTTSRPRS